MNLLVQTLALVGIRYFVNSLELVLPAFAALWFGIAAVMVCILFWLFQWWALPLKWSLGDFIDFMSILWFKFIKPLSIDKTQAGLSREATIGQVGSGHPNWTGSQSNRGAFSNACTRLWWVELSKRRLPCKSRRSCWVLLISWVMI